MTNYTKYSVAEEGRLELHDKLNLTGAEISVNVLPAGANVPFVHSHKQNEEIYLILDGAGKAIVDDETIVLKKGDCLRVAPEGRRQFFAAEDSSLKYVCIQVKAGSLEGFTATDAII